MVSVSASDRCKQRVRIPARLEVAPGHGLTPSGMAGSLYWTSFLPGSGVLLGRFTPFDPNQPMFFPPDLRDALTAGHAALLVSELVEQSDLSEIQMARPDEGSSDTPALDPRMLLRV